MRGYFTRRELVQAAAALCGAGFASGQNGPVFSTEVKVVNVLATVRNKTGSLVGNLSQDDFSLTEDGRPQTIRYFQHESNLPLILGLMVDTSGSQVKVLDQERAASLRFLDRVFRENIDHAFIMQFDTSVQLRQPLTGSIKKLDDAMAYVDSETMRQLRMQGGGGTLLYDAVSRAASEVMKRQTGRKALIVLSDGVDFGSEASVNDSVEAAQRADTLIYSILFSDESYPYFEGPDGRGVLMKLSKDTGASFFEVSKKRGIEQIYAAIEEELRSQYNLGFVSDRPNEISEFRVLKLSTKQKGLVVQCRERYWAKA